jgi:hypothetical protein
MTWFARLELQIEYSGIKLINYKNQIDLLIVGLQIANCTSYKSQISTASRKSKSKSKLQVANRKMKTTKSRIQTTNRKSQIRIYTTDRK